MKKQTSLIALLLLALLAPVAGQTPPPSPTTQPAPQQKTRDESDEDVVKITSNLVQFDAVVTDKKGQLITDLRPEDFEVFVGGKRQEITNFSYVSAETGTVTSAPPAAKTADKSAPPVPPARLRPSQVRRTIALVVDDLGTSWESTAHVRQALKKFVDEQMQAGDLVAIMRTSAGMGALQQFTSDKAMLYRAIERVRWYPSGRSGVSAFGPIQADPFANSGIPEPSGGRSTDNATAEAELDEFRADLFSVGTLGALNFIVRGMSELPGRKSVVMFSDGFKIMSRRDNTLSNRVIDSLRRLADLANRASVVVYTVDARGLPVLGFTAEDNLSGRSTQQLADLRSQRSNDYFDTQSGLQMLAAETGGLFLHDTNDLGGAVRRVLDDQKGYYLIGYRPDASLFETVKGRRQFNSYQVKVKRPGLHVRYRSGFMGITDEEAKPVRRTRSEQLIGALSSPLASGDLRLRLTSLFGGDSAGNGYVTSLVHVDMSDVKFNEEADGWQKAVIDVFALTFGEEGQVIDQVNRTETVRARGEALDIIRQDGLVYTMRVPVKKPGAYQLRIAVRDASTEKLGAANQFIDVPNLKKNRLALSGIIMQSTNFASTAAAAEDKPQDSSGSPAVRRFRLGEELDYYFNIYNARLDAATSRPQLQTQMRLFREGKEVYVGTPTPYEVGKQQADMKILASGARIRLNSGLQPGDYVLQVIVTDLLAPAKERTASQWIDFEVVK